MFYIQDYISNGELFLNETELIDGDNFDFLQTELLQSDPLVERVSNEDRKRSIRGFNNKTKLDILHWHNLYRGNVTPSAGDMNFMEWDDRLENLAQLWADGCVFAHGKPPGSYPFGPYGQNLYIGTDPSGYKGLWLWYEEYQYYDIRGQKCNFDQQCGHYIQMAWAESYRLGCGIRKCGLRYLIVCHYFPAALRGQQMYTIAAPCSQCSQDNGPLCGDNLCISWRQYELDPKLQEIAECRLKCRNCGRLIGDECRCICADGWDSPDCSRVCKDEHKRCGKSPGFPNKASCSMNRHEVAKKYCRQMCHSCNAFSKNNPIGHKCCGGQSCGDGFVLDAGCHCRLLCPGPLCDSAELGDAAARTGVAHITGIAVCLSYLYNLFFFVLS